MMDAAHHPGGRGLRRRGLSHATPRRCCSSRSTGCPAGVEAAVAVGRPGRPRARRAHGAGRGRRGRAGAALEGPQVGVRRDRPHRARLLPARRGRARARGWSRCCARCTRSPTSSDLIVMNVFHAGDGNLHPLLVFDAREPGIWERVHARRRRDRARVRRRRGRADRRARHRAREARGDAARLHRRRPRRAGPAARRVRPDGRANPQKVLPRGSRCGEAMRVPEGRGCERRARRRSRRRGRARADAVVAVGAGHARGRSAAPVAPGATEVARARPGIVELRPRRHDRHRARRHAGRRARRRAGRARPGVPARSARSGRDRRRRARDRALRPPPAARRPAARPRARGALRHRRRPRREGRRARR